MVGMFVNKAYVAGPATGMNLEQQLRWKRTHRGKARSLGHHPWAEFSPEAAWAQRSGCASLSAHSRIAKEAVRTFPLSDCHPSPPVECGFHSTSSERGPAFAASRQFPGNPQRKHLRHSRDRVAGMAGGPCPQVGPWGAGPSWADTRPCRWGCRTCSGRRGPRPLQGAFVWEDPAALPSGLGILACCGEEPETESSKHS